MSAIAEIDWQEARVDNLPDADTTVLIELDPATEYSDPVFMGYHDGECWRDVHGVQVDVVSWAHPPAGRFTA